MYVWILCAYINFHTSLLHIPPLSFPSISRLSLSYSIFLKYTRWGEVYCCTHTEIILGGKERLLVKPEDRRDALPLSIQEKANQFQGAHEWSGKQQKQFPCPAAYSSLGKEWWWKHANPEPHEQRTHQCLLYLQNDKYLLRFFGGQPEGLQKPVISRRGKQKMTEDVGVRNLQDFFRISEHRIIKQTVCSGLHGFTYISVAMVSSLDLPMYLSLLSAFKRKKRLLQLVLLIALYLHVPACCQQHRPTRRFQGAFHIFLIGLYSWNRLKDKIVVLEKSGKM